MKAVALLQNETFQQVEKALVERFYAELLRHPVGSAEAQDKHAMLKAMQMIRDAISNIASDGKILSKMGD